MSLHAHTHTHTHTHTNTHTHTHSNTQAVSSKPYLRKKAILVLYRIFLKFPDALRPAYPRLKEKIEDPDSGVQCAAISVICELARKNPKNYLSLAPTLFKIMTTSSNNWMLIKVIKLVSLSLWQRLRVWFMMWTHLLLHLHLYIPSASTTSVSFTISSPPPPPPPYLCL